MKTLIHKIRKTNFVELMQGLTLLLVALLLLLIVSPLSMAFHTFYYLITVKLQTGVNKLGSWLKTVALSVDQLGNVLGGDMFAILFTKKGGHHFGDPDDTISYVLARNFYKRKLNIFGKLLYWILNKIESGHGNKSIQSKIESDQDGVMRLEKYDYYD